MQSWPHTPQFFGSLCGSTQAPPHIVSRHVQAPFWQSGAGCAHPVWFAHEPVTSHRCGVGPEHRAAFGEQTPTQVPLPMHANGHVWVVCHAPVESQVCLAAPSHWASPGTHFPVHVPREQPKGHDCAVCHSPDGLQVSTPPGEHRFAPGMHSCLSSPPPPASTLASLSPSAAT